MLTSAHPQRARAVALTILVVAFPAFASAQAVEFVGRVGFFHRGFSPAVLTVDKLDGRFKATLSFTHFKETIGPEKVTSVAEFDERYDTLFDGQTRGLPEFARYKATADRFVNDVMSRVAALADDAVATPEAKQWFRSLVNTRPVKGAGVLAAVERVRLTFLFDDATTQVLATRASVAAAAAKSLARIGLGVDPASASELVITVGSVSNTVRSRLGFQTAESNVFSVWAAVSLRAPVIAPRADGYHRVRAALASTIAGESVKTDTFSNDTLAGVIDEAIGNLAADIDNRAAFLAADAAWREDLLSRLPGLELVFRAFVATTQQTNAQAPSYAGITTLAPLRSGVSPFNRSVGLDLATSIFGNRFDPSPAWKPLFRYFRRSRLKAAARAPQLTLR